MMSMKDCPYGADTCPKVQDLEERVAKMEKNQTKMMGLLYFIAGVVSVSLGVTVII